MTISKTKKLILSAILLALLIVLSRFLSIKTPLLAISFSFVPIMLSAILLGPKYTVMIAALGDLIGAVLFPFGTYFPGFTVSATISGALYGVFLYRKQGEEISNKKFIFQLAISTAIEFIVVRLLLNAIWLNIMYGKAFWVVVSSRALAQLILYPICIITMFALEKALRPFFKKYLYEEME